MCPRLSTTVRDRPRLAVILVHILTCRHKPTSLPNPTTTMQPQRNKHAARRARYDSHNTHTTINLLVSPG